MDRGGSADTFKPGEHLSAAAIPLLKSLDQTRSAGGSSPTCAWHLFGLGRRSADRTQFDRSSGGTADNRGVFEDALADQAIRRRPADRR